MLERKADGSLRLCVDYRKLNSKTRRDAFPLLGTDDSFDVPRGAKFLFLTIDLWSGYYQVAVHESDRTETVFTAPFGLYDYVRIPFSDCNRRTTFQRLMQVAMSDLIFQMLLIYLDEILVF